MRTREKIADAALTLFSTRGFKGTSMKNIAAAVGIKDSSVYKHFKSKQEIFDTIVHNMYSHMGRLVEKLGIPHDDDFQTASRFYETLSLAGLKKLSRNVFLFYLTDNYISRFWRMANIEQYRNPHIYAIFRRVFMEDAIDYQKKLFQIMMDTGVFIKADPEVVAINFYAPIFLLLSKYAGRIDGKDEALAILDRQVEEFYRIYRVK